MLEKMQQVRRRRKMRLWFHLGASQLTLLSLTLLSPVPRTVTSYPTALLPAVNEPELESALLHPPAAQEDPSDGWLIQPDTWAEWSEDPRLALQGPRDKKEEEDRPWEEEVLLRTQRGDLMSWPLSPFPGGHSLETIHYQEGGEGEDGGKRNEALTSIAGGLQAVSREKGGFGFRFGRKRWTDRGWVDEGRGSTEESKGE